MEDAASVSQSVNSLAWLKPAFHDADTDTLAYILARKSVSASWNAGFSELGDGVM